MATPEEIAAVRLSLDRVNARIASGVKDIRENGRSITFDLAVLESERLRLETVLTNMTPTTSAPRIRRLLVTSPTKGY